MGWFVGVLAGALIGTGAWALSADATRFAAGEESWRTGPATGSDENERAPIFRPTRAPGSEPGSEGDERQIRPPVQRGPEEFYRKPPRERKPRDRMYA